MLWWNEKNQFLNEDDNVLATVEWDKEFNSWAYDNLLTACGETEIPTMEEAMEKAERELLQGWGGYIVFLDEKDQEEYENVEE